MARLLFPFFFVVVEKATTKNGKKWSGHMRLTFNAYIIIMKPCVITFRVLHINILYVPVVGTYTVEYRLICIIVLSDAGEVGGHAMAHLNFYRLSIKIGFCNRNLFFSVAFLPPNPSGFRNFKYKEIENMFCRIFSLSDSSLYMNPNI